MPYSPALQKFITENDAYVRAQISKNRDDPFWAQTGLLYRQFDGLYDGYAAAATANDPKKLLSKDVIYAINIMGDLDDLCPAFGCEKTVTTCSNKEECDIVNARLRKISRKKLTRHPVARKGDEHCSILIKPLGDPKAPTDVVFGHTVCSFSYPSSRSDMGIIRLHGPTYNENVRISLRHYLGFKTARSRNEN